MSTGRNLPTGAFSFKNLEGQVQQSSAHHPVSQFIESINGPSAVSEWSTRASRRHDQVPSAFHHWSSSSHRIPPMGRVDAVTHNSEEVPSLTMNTHDGQNDQRISKIYKASVTKIPFSLISYHLLGRSTRHGRRSVKGLGHLDTCTSVASVPWVPSTVGRNNEVIGQTCAKIVITAEHLMPDRHAFP